MISYPISTIPLSSGGALNPIEPITMLSGTWMMMPLHATTRIPLQLCDFVGQYKVTHGLVGKIIGHFNSEELFEPLPVVQSGFSEF